jgi:multicomponent Na+:H+ antiporter subunit G
MTGLIGSLFILVGAFFHFSAGLGMLLIGIGVYHPGWTLKLVILIYFVFMTNPVSSHALARAARASGIPMARKDDARSDATSTAVRDGA